MRAELRLKASHSVEDKTNNELLYTPPRKRPTIFVKTDQSDEQSDGEPLSTPVQVVHSPGTRLRLQEQEEARAKTRHLRFIISNIKSTPDLSKELVQRITDHDSLGDSNELNALVEDMKVKASTQHTMDSLETALKNAQARAALMDVMQGIEPPKEEKARYFPGRKIDRREVMTKIFKGQQLCYEEMFASRGYRGLNIVPFPRHV